MFRLFKTSSETAAEVARAAQERTLKIEQAAPANDDVYEEKYHHKFFGRDDADITA